MTKSNKTLKDILDIVLYENPATQDEIAEKLGLSRRYVTKLLKPLIDDEVVKRAYILDLKKYEKFSDHFDDNIVSKDHSATFLIKGMLQKMSKHVSKQLNMAFDSLVENNKEKAEIAMEMDYTTNNMFEKLRASVETVVSIDPYSQFSKTVTFNEIAYNLERIGDYSDHFSKFVINEQYEIDEEMMKFLKSMYKKIDKMIFYSMDSFLNGNLKLKGDLMDLEEDVHKLQKKALNCIAIEMAESSFEDKDRSTYYIYLSRIVKSFERIGDICVEIMDTATEFHKSIPRSTVPRTFRDKL
ncbi:MAG: winged helix-turn-helix transcriptional regulator [Methanobacteriaceae archaeon]|jgi:phosphate transport system protein|nr:winged helix-turn-helix transcriptional regulator [Candidatus Methanorudis spinitermitis]